MVVVLLPIAARLALEPQEQVEEAAVVVVGITMPLAVLLVKQALQAQALARMTELLGTPDLALPQVLAGRAEPALETLAALADLAAIGAPKVTAARPVAAQSNLLVAATQVRAMALPAMVVMQ